MALLDILRFPDARLRTKAVPVTEVTDGIREFVDDMLETMYAAPGIGLAATQVNVHQQIVVVDVSEEKDQPICLINPEIIHEEGEEICEEGCLSVPEYFAEVQRADTITVKALDRDGKEFELNADGTASKSSKLNIVYAGTPDFAVPALQSLIKSKHNVVVLDMPRYGCLNIHGSLLPRWRGAAPIHRAIQSGDSETGVTIMQMALGLDTGDMLLKRTCRITPDDTSQTIHDHDALSNYAEKLNKAEAEIDWSKPAAEIDLKIRAFNPWPVAFTLHNGKPLRIYMSKVDAGKSDALPGTVIDESPEGIKVATGEGVLSFSRLQLPAMQNKNNKQSINPRANAARILQSVIYKGESLSTALANNDSPLVSDLCYGSLRWHEPLSALIKILLSKSIKKKDKDVECLIRVGLYQIIYQKTPDHAAVGETVNALKSLKKPWAKNLVNAVLRNFLRGQEKLQKEMLVEEPAKYAFPQWLIDRLKEAWPENWEEILEQSNLRSPMTLRVNLSHQTREEYLKILALAGIEAEPIKDVETAVKLSSPQNVNDLPGFADGAVSVQDGAAQLAGILLDCQDGMKVLDACAAPGGKTGHILESAKNLNLIALDNSELRMRRVKENLDRLQLNATLVVEDALKTESYADGLMFDRILLDAPCSATGVIRRHPDIKILRRNSDILELQKLQAEMLQKLWEKLKPGGILLYATCSILPEENEEQIRKFIG
ncbi:Ribosomal RNA small subunit methyltransferase B [Nymphon striatum]|nr:Ribosomal RNA small subunit methyltransferase B [Nymphon striatum]